MFVKRFNRIFKLCKRNHSVWSKPEGFDTGIKVYNCVAKTTVPLILNNKNRLLWYTCGPTVYDSSHIGHASTYVKLDILQRILRNYFNINVISVMNITDVDDKIIKGSIDRKMDCSELSKLYEKEFFRDLNNLNVNLPDKVLRVTENMSVIITFINKLLETEKAYIAKNGSVYFDIGAYNGVYGKLQNIGDVQGAPGVKKSSADFALWKSAKVGEPSWESPFGPGRPGWHIECSALAGTMLGSSIDIHAGGIDLRFPHHENEEAQSCAYFDTKQWVNYWLHTGYLHLSDSVKMSKSLRNTITIEEMLETGSSDDFRMACLLSHYRNNMDFSSELLHSSGQNLKYYMNFLNECTVYLNSSLRADVDAQVLFKMLEDASNNIDEALRNDFDTAASFKILNNLISTTNKMLYSSADANSNLDGSAAIVAIKNFTANVLDVFGFKTSNINNANSSEHDLSAIMDILVTFRGDIRLLAIKKKDKDILQCCDEVRNELSKLNYNLKDRKDISTWSK